MDYPHEIHLRATKIILNFVKGTKTHGIHYVAQSSLELVGFTDSYWVGDNTDMNSTFGYVFIISYGQIMWSSKKKIVIAISSTEIEYIGIVNATTQCLWLQGILRECGSN